MGIFVSVCFKKVRKSVCRFTSFFLIITNLNVVIKELLDPMNLTKTQNFFIYKFAKIIIIYKNKNLVVAVFEVVLLGFISLDYS